MSHTISKKQHYSVLTLWSDMCCDIVLHHALQVLVA